MPGCMWKPNRRLVNPRSSLERDGPLGLTPATVKWHAPHPLGTGLRQWPQLPGQGAGAFFAVSKFPIHQQTPTNSNLDIPNKTTTTSPHDMSQ